MTSINLWKCPFITLNLAFLLRLSQLLTVQGISPWNAKFDDCSEVPRDTSLIRQPGDGPFTITFQLIPPDSTLFFRGNVTRETVWPDLFPFERSSSDETAVNTAQSTEYLPGRVYDITIDSKWNAVEIEAAYVTVVPVGTPESQEHENGLGRFAPTLCKNITTGAIELAFNFPKSLTFQWTAPTSHWNINNTRWISRSPSRQCLEIRATVVPWHWHRIYYRNTGDLRRIVCAAKEVRRIDDWPNYMESVNIMTKSKGTKTEPLKEHSENKEVGDGHQIKLARSVEMHDSASSYYAPTGEDLVGTTAGGGCPVQELPKPVRPCCACNTAIYRLVIQSEWQQQQHWRDWPSTGSSGSDTGTADSPDTPHWSEILGASHSPLYDIFHAGGNASPAVDAFCTTSDLSKLENEFRNQAGDNIFTVIRARGIISALPPEQRIRSAMFAVNSSHHLISFLTRLVPSPDWCTGLSRIDVCLPNCSWPLRVQYRLEPWDAGVMTGNTYVPIEPPERLRDPQPMCPITPDLRPNTPFTVLKEYDGMSMDNPINALHLEAQDDHLMGNSVSFLNAAFQQDTMHDSMGPFHSQRPRKRFARLGLVQLERIRINEHESCAPDPVQDDQAIYRTTSGTAKRSGYPSKEISPETCELSSWSTWQPCTIIDLDTCNNLQAREYWAQKSPRMHRTRHILSSADKTDCADAILREEKYCKPPTLKAPCGPVPSTTSSSTSTGDEFRLATVEYCQNLPWGPWSDCLNVSCERIGMIYRWRQFPDIQTKLACENFPSVSQVDTCWPPVSVVGFDGVTGARNCSLEELQSTCAEDPPTSERLCIKSKSTFKRFYYDAATKQCLMFDYDPKCHLMALKANHPIGHTRNVFRDLISCQSLCLSASNPLPHSLSQRVKRSSTPSICYLPVHKGVVCPTGNGMSLQTRWYYNAYRKRCLAFHYAGCGGTLNNFDTPMECRRRCISLRNEQ